MSQPVTPAYACHLAAEFFSLLLQLAADGCLRPNEKLVQQLGSLISLCQTATPTTQDCEVAETYLEAILYAMDTDQLFDGAPDWFIREFERCLEIAGSACVAATENVSYIEAEGVSR